MTQAIIAGLVLAFVAALVSRYFTLLDHREERAHQAWRETEQRKDRRTADVVAIAEKADIVEAALLKHEERISILETAGSVARRPGR